MEETGNRVIAVELVTHAGENRFGGAAPLSVVSGGDTTSVSVDVMYALCHAAC